MSKTVSAKTSAPVADDTTKDRAKKNLNAEKRKNDAKVVLDAALKIARKDKDEKAKNAAFAKHDLAVLRVQAGSDRGVSCNRLVSQGAGKYLLADYGRNAVSHLVAKSAECAPFVLFGYRIEGDSIVVYKRAKKENLLLAAENKARREACGFDLSGINAAIAALEGKGRKAVTADDVNDAVESIEEDIAA